MKIPKKFKLFGTTININFQDSRLSYQSSLGDCSYIDGEINLCREYKGKPLNKDAIIDTFYHEKVHVILDGMGEHELSANEKFVDVFSKLLRQSDETAEYKEINGSNNV